MSTSQHLRHDAWRTARAEAAAWVSRLHAPGRTPALEAAFRDWLTASSDNKREFEYVTEVWDAAKLIPMGGMPRQSPWSRSTGPRGWALAATVLLTCGLAAFVLYENWFADRYSTGIGEQRLLRLSDGTRISLNSASQVEIDYDDTQRGVRLKRGEAFFEVAQNLKRPFVVYVGVGQVKALGTAFVVRYDDNRMAVTLVEGKVAVTSSTAAEALTLAPGQRLTLAARTAPRVDTPRIEAVTAWRRGEVVLEKTPLVDAIHEMNRYDETKLVVASPAIGSLQVSGMYHTGDSQGFAKTVAMLYGLQIVEGNNEIHFTGNPVPVGASDRDTP